jgi:two-component system NtrC family response regulator
VILMTAWGNIDLAVRGMRAGAFDFITKPWNNATLMQRVETALETGPSPALPVREGAKSKKSTVPPLLGEVGKGLPIIGKSAALTEVLDTVERIAKTNAPVLITGESGTGKELIAEAIHRSSLRSDKPFVKVNLGGISTSLFESEMFGHKKGAFTNAFSDRKGRFEMADGGTIFLDEIGELELPSQVKLLRVLQDMTYEVLGDSRQRRCDVRVVCATNANLVDMVAERTFREDLYYRINLITIHLPALRERTEDIPLLVRHFADKASEQNALPRVEITADAINYLKTLPYPGNIRELKGLVERTMLMNQGKELGKTECEACVVTSPSTAEMNIAGGSIEDTERQLIINAIEKYQGNMSKVASALGISRGALYRRLEKYGIK